MVEWTDEAIIIDNKKYNENSNIATAISKNHGLYSSILKYAFSQVNRSTFQIGNIVKLTWRARLGEQMGYFIGETEINTSSNLFNNRMANFAISTAAFIIKNALSERTPEKELYNKFYKLVTSPLESDHIKKNYLSLEESILKNCGYALDYSKCAVSETRNNLYYLSPKTGKAVSKEIGDPYADKLFILPQFFINKKIKITDEDLIRAFEITGYFIEKYLLRPKNLSLPETRNLLLYSN